MDALASLSPIVEAGAPLIILVGAVFARISAVVMLTPGLGERAVPMRARLAAAIAIAMVLTPIVLKPDMAPPQTIAGIVALYTAEF